MKIPGIFMYSGIQSHGALKGDEKSHQGENLD